MSPQDRYHSPVFRPRTFQNFSLDRAIKRRQGVRLALLCGLGTLCALTVVISITGI